MKIPIKNRLVRGVVSTIAFLAIVAVAFLVCYGIGWISPATRLLFDQGRRNLFLLFLAGVLHILGVFVGIGVVTLICSAISALSEGIFDP